MTTVHSALPIADLLEAVLSGEGVNWIAESVRLVLPELIEAEAAVKIGAGRYERTETRVNERNGARDRLLTTQAGDIELRIPKLRHGWFLPSVLEPRRRIDQALHAVILEAVNGVSTRRAGDLAEALGATSGISKSQVSRICADLDGFAAAFRTRPLGHAEFPYVYLDATYLHVREHGLGQVVSKAAVVATGVRADGVREVLGVDVGDSEDETLWSGFLPGLKARGLSGVRLVVSDQHSGLVAAMGKCFQGGAHQRCRVHFAHNLLALFPKSRKEMVATLFRTIFAQPDPDAISAQWNVVRDQLSALAGKAGPMMDQAKAEVLAFACFPKAHWVKVWSNNPPERLNKDIKRRSRVVGIFPSEASVIRLAGAILADTNDEWHTGDHRYLSEESMKLLATSYPEPVTAITHGSQHTGFMTQTPPLRGTLSATFSKIASSPVRSCTPDAKPCAWAIASPPHRWKPCGTTRDRNDGRAKRHAGSDDPGPHGHRGVPHFPSGDAGVHRPRAKDRLRALARMRNRRPRHVSTRTLRRRWRVDQGLQPDRTDTGRGRHTDRRGDRLRLASRHQRGRRHRLDSRRGRHQHRLPRRLTFSVSAAWHA